MFCPTERSVLAAVVAAGALPCLGGCLDRNPEPGEDGGAPRIVRVGDVLLAETDQYYLANPWSLVVDTADGSFLVSDAFAGQIIRFDRAGRVMQRYGGPGDGPAEFQRMGATFILNDSVVVGLDARRRLLKLFSREGGEYLESFRYRGFIGGDLSVVDGMVVAPSMDTDGLTSVMIWDPARGSFSYLVDLPEPYLESLERNGPFAGTLMGGSVLAWSDTMLVGMLGMDELYLTNRLGQVLDTVRAPSVRRRGVADDMHVRYDTDMSLSFRDRIEMKSLLVGVYRLLNGETVLVHADQSVKGEPPSVEFLADFYATVLSADRQAACVDGFVPYGNEIRARLTVSRDTVFLLDRTLNETDDGLKTWVRLYEIDTSRCDWLSTG